MNRTIAVLGLLFQLAAAGCSGANAHLDSGTPVDAGDAGSACSVCSPSASCSLESGKAVCTCESGFVGDGGVCSDVDECANSTATCDSNATCSNTDGGFDCDCNAGFKGDGGSCGSAWTLVRNIPGVQLGQYHYVAASPTAIYIANASNQVSGVYFKRYQFSDDSVIDLTTNAIAGNITFCACGYNGTPVADTTNLYYVANDAFSYTFATDSWAAMAYPSATHRGESATTIANSQIYFVGGRGPISSVEAYAPSSNTWTVPGSSLLNYPVSVTGAVAASIGGKIYVFGGTTGAGFVNTYASYDVSTNVWSPLSTAPAAFDFSSISGAAALGSKIYLSTYSDHALKVYDTSTKTWDASELPNPLGSKGTNLTPVFSNNALYLVLEAPGMIQIYKYTP